MAIDTKMIVEGNCANIKSVEIRITRSSNYFEQRRYFERCRLLNSHRTRKDDQRFVVLSVEINLRAIKCSAFLSAKNIKFLLANTKGEKKRVGTKGGSNGWIACPGQS